MALSRGEAEFYAAVVCAKIFKYLRYVFFKLDAKEMKFERAYKLKEQHEPKPRDRRRISAKLVTKHISESLANKLCF